MSYRNPNPNRMLAQSQDVFQFAGVTALWQQYVSASTGNGVIGRGATPYYTTQTITALLAPVGQPGSEETQQAAGMIQSDTLQVTTRELLGVNDQLVWRGVNYRVDSDPIPARVPGYWVTTMKRGYST